MAEAGSRLDPDGKKFRAQIAALNLPEVLVTIMGIGVGGEIEALIEEALRRIGMCVNDDGGVVNGASLGRDIGGARIVSLSKCHNGEKNRECQQQFFHTKVKSSVGMGH